MIRALAGLAALGITGFAAHRYLIHVPWPAPPPLGSSLRRGELRVGDRRRTFAYYAPRDLPPGAPLLLAFHGSKGDGEGFRRRTVHRFDELADREGFLVVYPDGFEGHWNDCRTVATYSARTQRIDDIGFVRALIAHFRGAHDIDASRVFAVGWSNGGHFCFRLAFEVPEAIRAIAAVSANLPTEDNCDCTRRGQPLSALIMNGTRDPLNPHGGGLVTIFGFGRRGTVVSSGETARSFASWAGITSEPRVERFPSRDAALWVERQTWSSGAGIEVVLDTVHGGGHVVPQRAVRAERILGPTNLDFDGPGAIWSFFARRG
ncbi:alpha/beta hydrolase family esterase [Pendulispora albinea]|uniref:Polyhydroxybutyrate depolymerase n=1 Tax=Pendulispora albinea TaxID=2741071 RepID=A0ABZ2LXY1_9BACT